MATHITTEAEIDRITKQILFATSPQRMLALIVTVSDMFPIDPDDVVASCHRLIERREITACLSGIPGNPTLVLGNLTVRVVCNNTV